MERPEKTAHMALFLALLVPCALGSGLALTLGHVGAVDAIRFRASAVRLGIGTLAAKAKLLRIVGSHVAGRTRISAASLRFRLVLGVLPFEMLTVGSHRIISIVGLSQRRLHGISQFAEQSLPSRRYRYATSE